MVVGASMGGSVAINLSKEIPELIDKIILLSPAGLFGECKNISEPKIALKSSFYIGKLEKPEEARDSLW